MEEVSNCDLEKEEMTDSEMWREHRKERQQKKAENEKISINLLISKEIPFAKQKGNSHYKIKGWDYWPTTGKFYNQKTGEVGRGIRNLIKIVKNEKDIYNTSNH